MPLPKLQYPVYDLVLPSTEQTIKFRPFLVREEKILLMAKQGQDANEIVNAVKQVINNCVIEPKINVDDLATFDIEYFFLKLRCKSVGSEVTLSYRDYEDNKVYDVVVNLDDVVIRRTPGHSNHIKINDSVGIKMKYPSAEIYSKIQTNSEDAMALEALRWCMDTIYDGDQIYVVSEYTSEEVEEFIQSLGVAALDSVLSFFTTMPKLFYEVKYRNSLGHDRSVELNSLSDFFTLG